MCFEWLRHKQNTQIGICLCGVLPRVCCSCFEALKLRPFRFILELWRMIIQRYDEISTTLFSTYHRTADQMKYKTFYCLTLVRQCYRRNLDGLGLSCHIQIFPHKCIQHQWFHYQNSTIKSSPLIRGLTLSGNKEHFCPGLHIMTMMGVDCSLNNMCSRPWQKTTYTAH